MIQFSIDRARLHRHAAYGLGVLSVLATTLEYLFRKPRIPESNWRQAGGRVAYAWHKNHWIVSNRLRPQTQPMQDGSCAVAAVDVA